MAKILLKTCPPRLTWRRQGWREKSYPTKVSRSRMLYSESSNILEALQTNTIDMSWRLGLVGFDSLGMLVAEVRLGD